MESSNVKLLSYKVKSYAIDPADKNSSTVNLYYKIEIKNGDVSQIIVKDDVQWKSVRENNIWKIKTAFEL